LTKKPIHDFSSSCLFPINKCIYGLYATFPKWILWRQTKPHILCIILELFITINQSHCMPKRISHILPCNITQVVILNTLHISLNHHPSVYHFIFHITFPSSHVSYPKSFIASHIPILQLAPVQFLILGKTIWFQF